MRYFIPLLLLIATITSCSRKQIILTETDTIQRVMTVYSRQQQKKHNMEIVVSGISGEPENIKGFIVHHVSHKKVDIDKARKIFVLSLQDFLKLVNGYPELQEQLIDSPLTEEAMQYNIGFTTLDGEFFDPPSVAYCYLKARTICSVTLRLVISTAAGRGMPTPAAGG